MIEQTFAMIKPDAVRDGNSGLIIQLIELNKFSLVRMQKLQLSQHQAEQFYGIHSDKPWFNEIISFIISGPVIVMALEKENAIADWRALMGPTDPAQAKPGDLRYGFGHSIGSNALHGSDGDETARQELGFFFPDLIA